MSQRDTRLIGGIYRTGQFLSSDGILTTYTAYNRNTNDVVGLYVLHCPPNVPPHVIQQVLQPLAQRRAHASPHLLHISDWGVDNNRILAGKIRGLCAWGMLSGAGGIFMICQQQ